MICTFTCSCPPSVLLCPARLVPVGVVFLVPGHDRARNSLVWAMTALVLLLVLLVCVVLTCSPAGGLKSKLRMLLPSCTRRRAL